MSQKKPKKNQLEGLEFRAPREPNIDKKDMSMPNSHLSSIKIVPMSSEECDRVLGLIEGNEEDEAKVPKKVEKKLPRKSPKKVTMKVPQKSEKRHEPEDPDDIPSSKNRKQTKPSKRKAKEQQPSASASYQERNSDLPVSPYANSRYSQEERIYPPVARSQPDDSRRVFQAVFGKYKPYKKHKEWTYDGFIVVTKDSVVLRSCSGKFKGRANRSDTSTELPKIFKDGTRVLCGGYEAELSTEIDDINGYDAGAYFVEEENE